MWKDEQYRADQYIARARNHPWLAAVIVIGIVIIALASFTDAAQKLIAIVSPNAPKVTLIKAELVTDPIKVRALRKELNDKGVSVPRLPPGFSPQIIEGDFDPANDSAWNLFPVLDVSVVNESDQVAILMEGVLYVTVNNAIEVGPINRKRIPPSWDYNVLIDMKTGTQKLRVPILDEVPPKSTSRFFITIGNNNSLVRASSSISAIIKCHDGQELQLGTFSVPVLDFYQPGLGRRLAVIQDFSNPQETEMPSEDSSAQKLNMSYPKWPVN